jgi:acetylornithine deacetylase/succinyl-diaminopimelate desuccinylase-like protein
VRLAALGLVVVCACTAPRSHLRSAAGDAATRASATTDYDGATAEVRELLGALVAADTSNPPGNEARAVALGAERLRAAGVAYEVTEFAPGRQNLVARLRGDGREPPLLLLAHTDVVGTGGQTWATDPHVMTERDGFLVGRGVGDDLGMAAVALEEILLLQRRGTALHRDVILAWTGDEESGGAGIRWLLANRPDSIRAVSSVSASVDFFAGEVTVVVGGVPSNGERGCDVVTPDPIR